MAVSLQTGSYRIGQVAPSNAAYNDLVALLQNDRLPAGRSVVVNGNGESPLWSEARVAAFVRSGGVYVDYCGWPFYYSGTTGGNWNQFLDDLGVSLGASHDFLLLTQVAGQDFAFDLSRYSWYSQYTSGGSTPTIPYPYGLATTTNLANKGFPVAPRFVSRLPLSPPVYVYNMFAIRAGRGLYFYAYNGIAVSTYAAFIASSLGGTVRAARQTAVAGAVSAGNSRATSATGVVRCVNVTVREGDRNGWVAALQRALVTHGYGRYLGTTGPAGNGVDGDFGPDTRAAVLAFQRAQHGRKNPCGTVVVDGVVGPANWYALGITQESAVPSSPATQTTPPARAQVPRTPSRVRQPTTYRTGHTVSQTGIWKGYGSAAKAYAVVNGKDVAETVPLSGGSLVVDGVTVTWPAAPSSGFLGEYESWVSSHLGIPKGAVLPLSAAAVVGGIILGQTSGKK